MDCRLTDPSMLQRAARFLQDLERSHRRRQYVHVAAGGRNDLARRRLRRTCYFVAARRGASGGGVGRFRHRQSRECTASRRVAAQNIFTEFGTLQTGSHAPGFPYQTWPLCRVVDRHERPRATGLAGDLTAATPRPVQFRFDTTPSTKELQDAIDARIPADGYFEDVHGSAAYKRHLTHHFAEQIHAELTQSEASS